LTFVVGGPAIGSFDGVSTSGCKVRGWAFDPDNPSTSINVHVYRDGPAGSGTFVMSCSANLSRSDVNSYYGISGYHGFDCSLPSSYQGTGSHNLYIHAIDINGSPNNVISNSPKSLSCSAPAVNGSCGTAAKSYVYNATRYTGSFCSSGTASPSSPAFPAQGGLRTWTCQGSNGGSTRSCTATRQSVPTPTLTLQASPSSVSYNSSSTLSWSSTNTTSCTAFSGWTGSKATSGSESTGNLTTSQTYTLSCTGPGGSITRSVEVNVGPSVPAVLPPVCSADGTSAQVRWTWPSGATSFALRINDTSNGWTGTCSSVNSGDVCGELSTNSYVKTTIPGRQYQVWVHAFANGVYSPASTVYTFSCPGPVTVTGRIYDQTTGQGVANITIPACANNPGTTTDVNGNYFFQVPFGQGFCIRPTMSIPFGWAGPILTGLPVVQQAQKTYEWQVAGVNLGDPVCLTNPSASGCTSWKQWDRAVDNGYDFMYTSPPPTLAICSSSCGSGSSALSSFTLGVNSTRTIYTCFGPGTGDTVCQNGSSTFSSWLIGNSSVADISPSSGSQTVVTGRSHQNSPTTLGASFSSGGQNYTASSSVSVICTPSCGDRSQKCSGQTYADSCGTVDACQGTRDCSSGAGDYKEVAP
ncbi:MAG: hypothetical protein KC736_00590, partial [Candidatus Moranbacteria bacterium]|nr:hypothetical protein [Candidatus Moranbacteria bacterium]